MLGCTLLVVAGVRFFWSPLSFRRPAPSWPLSLLVGALLAAAYLTATWAPTGRTYGGAVLGLRVLWARGGRVGWAAVRAGRHDRQVHIDAAPPPDGVSEPVSAVEPTARLATASAPRLTGFTRAT